jgi:moderate conductance mechanosensitive channel
MPVATESPQWVQQLDEWHLLTPLRILIVVLCALLATYLIKRSLSKVLRRALDLTSADRPRAEARYRALSSALGGAVVGGVWAITVILIVSYLGVNLGAFVATATIIGGALAFGAQNLVRDVISGIFVLADDQYGVGDDVDLGLASGTVERVTLRSARLRDGEGGVWYVQHGNVMRVANLSKTSVALLDVEVSRAMTVDAVMAAVERLAHALAEDEHTAELLVSTPVVVGITDVRDDRIVVRVSVATQPGQHHALRRAWRMRCLEAFERGDLVPPPALSALATPPNVKK